MTRAIPGAATFFAATLLLTFGSAGADPLRTARAVRVPEGSIRVDGKLREEAWVNAPRTDGFTQKDPDEGTPATRETRVSFLYDDEALYIGARMDFEDPTALRAIVSRRDNSGNSERFIVTLDTYHDRRTARSFAVTATGVRIDYYHAEDDEGDREYSYDPVWEARTAVGDHEWTAEMKIPFSQLRFNGDGPQVWGLNMNRWMPDRNEDTYWILIPKDETGWASRFGELRGIDGIRPSRRIELLPYFAADGSRRGEWDADDPFADRYEASARVGADLKMGVGPNVTIDAAVNPDFGQVEADPAEVNLTAYETIFPEKRPFFIEGSQLLQGTGPTYYYSRRIGASPRGDAGAEYAEAPENTTILTASKLTGRLPSGLSVGALGALTAREYARVRDDGTGDEGRVKVEPLTGYGVLRLQQQYGPNQSTAGVMLTGVRRDLDRGEDLSGELSRTALTGGADWLWYFRDKEYRLGGSAGFSHVAGEPDAIAAIQRSSAHYFQRPDADRVRLDTTRTSLTGYEGSLFVERRAGRHWRWDAGGSFETPGLELNDAGLLQSADDIESWGSIGYRETKPGRLFRSYAIGLYNRQTWNFDGDRTAGGHEIDLDATWRNHWSNYAGFYIGPRAMKDDLTRGGPLMEALQLTNAWIGVASNHASNVRWEASAAGYWFEEDGWRREAETALSLRAGGRWEFSVEPYYGVFREPRQYVTTLDGGRAETFDRRYVFSRIDRSTLRAPFRVSYALHPDLTVEVYAEPFAANGRYHAYGELKAPRSHDLIVYGEEDGTTIVRNEDGTRTVTYGGDEFTLENDDFHVLSFRSNVVVRWEWRAGSVVYFVWQQDRGSGVETAGGVGGRDLFDSFSAAGDQFVAVKISYWFPID